MTKAELQDRSKQLGINVYKWCGNLEFGYDKEVVGKQLVRSAASVGANYRAVCRARSSREFIAKLNICIEECDEVMFWLEFAEGIGYDKPELVYVEANELLSIFVSSRKTAEANLKNQES